MKKRLMLRTVSAVVTVALGMRLFPINANAIEVTNEYEIRLDVNKDGNIEITDAAIALSDYAGLSAFGKVVSEYDSDADGNGKVEIADAVTILYYYYAQKAVELKSNINNFLFVGNSSFIGNPDDENVTCITGENKGAMWTSKQEETILEYDNTNIVLCHSPKDTYDVLEYMRIYNTIRGIMQDVDKKNVEVYVMTLPPCTGKYESLNTEITNFNAFLKSMCNSKIHFIDAYEFAYKNGFETEEGLVYNEETQKVMYDFIISEIKGNS